jgi:hypothetical protein
MQTSRDLKKKHPIRVNAVGVGVGLALFVVGGGLFLNCAPGVLEKCANDSDEACICKNYGQCRDGGGTTTGGTSGGGEGGVADGDGGTSGSVVPTCKMWKDEAEIEEKFILPTCGKPLAPGADPLTSPACHNGAFVPEMDMAGMIADGLKMPDSATARKRLSCKADPWIAMGADWQKSFVLTKTDPTVPDGNKAVKCSNGATGMARMPFSVDATTAPPLTQDEYDCVRFYVYKLAGN